MSDNLPVIYLARHGETAWTLSGQHTGLTDLPLTEQGERNARNLGARLRGLTFARVLASPLQRAIRTCELAGFGAVAEIDRDLLEWDYGQYEGRLTAEIHKERPGWQLFRDGCPGGETPEQVGARADRVIGRVRAISADVLIFSSGHFLRILAARWLGLEPAGGRYFLLRTASLSALSYEHDLSQPAIRLWDDTRHVEVELKLSLEKQMTIGFDKPLYVLPFDHRATFQTKMFGWKGTLTPSQSDEITATKRVIYDGFKAALSAGVPKEKAGILVDEQFGSDILRDAARNGFSTAYTVEKSGQEEFDFEYGEEFGRHIEAFNPTFAKVLVRYNPEGDSALNQRQASRLKRLSDYLHGSGRMLMFELLVPATKAQFDRVNDQKAYDLELRPGLMVQAIRQLQEVGVEPDVWKIEGIDRREDCEKVVAAARQNGRDKVGCIVLGRGEDDAKVREWLAVAASVPGFIGFAVGRTSFWEPLMNWRAKKATRDEAVAGIARRYQEWVGIFEQHSAPVRRAGGG